MDVQQVRLHTSFGGSSVEARTAVASGDPGLGSAFKLIVSSYTFYFINCNWYYCEK